MKPVMPQVGMLPAA